MAKLGRKKKEILERDDLNDFNKFQDLIRENAEKIGCDNLTQQEKAFIREFIVTDSDSAFVAAQKMYKFKHYVLKKPLTLDECSYLVDVDNNGTKPSESKKLSKMRICTLESGAMEKLRKAFGDKFSIRSLKDFTLSGEDRRMPAKQINTKEI